MSDLLVYTLFSIAMCVPLAEYLRRKLETKHDTKYIPFDLSKVYIHTRLHVSFFAKKIELVPGGYEITGAMRLPQTSTRYKTFVVKTNEVNDWVRLEDFSYATLR